MRERNKKGEGDREEGRGGMGAERMRDGGSGEKGREMCEWRGGRGEGEGKRGNRNWEREEENRWSGRGKKGQSSTYVVHD